MQERDGLFFPCNVRKLQVLEIGNGDTSSFENMARFGSGQAERGKFVADVRDLNIVGDDVAIEQLQHFFSLLLFGIDQERFSALENVKIRLNAPLRVQQEGIDAVAAGQIANVVRGHAIQPTNAVA